jgi:hypothetical protein
MLCIVILSTYLVVLQQLPLLTAALVQLSPELAEALELFITLHSNDTA